MPISNEDKKKYVEQFGKDSNDTGSSEVQIAILTHRIRELTEHVKIHKKDHHTRRGLVMLVAKRKKMMKMFPQVLEIKTREILGHNGFIYYHDLDIDYDIEI